MTAAELRRRLESPPAFRLAMGLYAVALALGLKHFLVWDQILVLEGAGLWPVLSSLHPHALRWLVMQPALAFGHVGIAPDAAFTVICFGLIWMTVRLLARVGAIAGGCPERESALRIWLFLPLALATFLMNGRLIPAFAGISLLVALHVEQAAALHDDRPHSSWRVAWLIAGQGVGLLLLSVSSGTFAVGVISVVWSWLSMVGRRRDLPSRHSLIIWSLIFGIVLAAVCWLLGHKAVTYFDGRLVNILEHGFGHFLTPWGLAPALLGCGVVAVTASVVAWVWRFPQFHGSHLRIPIAASVVLGLVGYATLLTALPIAVLVGVLLMARE